MMYFVHPDTGAIAACEDERYMAAIVRRGFKRCTRKYYIECWRDNYMFRFAELRADAREAWARRKPVRERSVGGGAPPPGFVKMYV